MYATKLAPSRRRQNQNSTMKQTNTTSGTSGMMYADTISGYAQMTRNVWESLAQAMTKSGLNVLQLSDALTPTALAVVAAAAFALHPLVSWWLTADTQVLRLAGEPPRWTFVGVVGAVTQFLVPVVLPGFAVAYVGGHLLYNVKYVNGLAVYGGSAETGFLVHVGCGSAWFVLAPLQFYGPLRRRFPVLHRRIGYTALAVSAVSGIGLLGLLPRAHAGVSVQLLTVWVLPMWAWCNYAAWRAIAIYRDVETHRRLNILSLALSATIVLMRPVTLAFMAVHPSWTFGRALGLTAWVVTGVVAAATAWYLHAALVVPAQCRPRLQHSGHVLLAAPPPMPLPPTMTMTTTSATSSSSSKGTSGFLPARVTSYAALDTSGRSLLLAVHVESDWDLVIPPGWYAEPFPTHPFPFLPPLTPFITDPTYLLLLLLLLLLLPLSAVTPHRSPPSPPPLRR